MVKRMSTLVTNMARLGARRHVNPTVIPPVPGDRLNPLWLYFVPFHYRHVSGNAKNNRQTIEVMKGMMRIATLLFSLA